MNLEDVLRLYKEGGITKAQTLERLRQFRARGALTHLSEGQRGLWVMEKMFPEKGLYNVPLCYRLGVNVNIELIEKAINAAVTRHPALSCIIVENDGVPYQKEVASENLIEIAKIDISMLSQQEVLPYLRARAREPFVFSTDPLMKVMLLVRSEAEVVLLIVVHHIVFDGRSAAILLSDFFEFYDCLSDGRDVRPVSLQTTYVDYVDWEQRYLGSAFAENDRSYWLQNLTGCSTELSLAMSSSKSEGKKGDTRIATQTLSVHLTAKIRELSVRENVYCSALFLAAYKILLYRYTNQDDINVGMSVVGRPNEQFDAVVGHFINMVVVRSKISREESVVLFARGVQRTVLGALDHSMYPFSRLVHDLNVQRPSERPPLFQVIFDYKSLSLMSNEGATIWSQKAFDVTAIEGVRQESGGYELALEVMEQTEQFQLSLAHSDALHESIAKQFITYLVALLETMVIEPDCRVSDLRLMIVDERRRSEERLVDCTDNEGRQPLVHDMVAKQAALNPSAIALIGDGRSLTYKQLDQRANQLANLLQGMGVHPETVVASCMERSVDMVVCMLGILKAGACYLPLDPAYPAQRLTYMANDAGAKVLLTNSNVAVALGNFGLPTFMFDQDHERLAQQSRKAPRCDVVELNLAYIIYTSGSTGTPKGVMIPHLGISNLVVSQARDLEIGAGSRVLQCASPGFDVAILEVLVTLSAGATLCLFPGRSIANGPDLSEVVVDNEITVLALPVSALTFLDRSKTYPIKTLVIGGETCAQSTAEFWASRCSLINEYGPTEASVCTSLDKYECGDERVTIGRPIANTQILILDEQLERVPIGVTGELYIGGVGLARGYVNNCRRTAESFVPNPFGYGERLYKTGDLARYLPDQRIEFIGRVDNQLKIRGFRIELGEIESALSQHESVEHCVVVATEDDHKKLIACIVTVADKSQPMPEDLRLHLRKYLPEHMLPATYLFVAKLPLTQNAKIDRAALLSLHAKNASSRNVELHSTDHCSDVETKVLAIWLDILKLPSVANDQGFFDVGGDSILAVTTAERVSKALGVAFKVTDLFRYSTIKDIARFVEKNSNSVESTHSSSKHEKQEKRSKRANVAKIPEESGVMKDGSLPSHYEKSVAVIGISCQLPGASDYRSLWANLRNGVESVQRIPLEELRTLGIPETLIQNPSYVPVQSTIEGRENFDATFFKVSSRDAELMDPQLRLLLQHSWQAIEDSGYLPEDLRDAAVFMSATYSGYQSLVLSEHNLGADASDHYAAYAFSQVGSIPTVISSKLGLKGPSLFVHSNCSSSLVGLDAAYHNIISGTAGSALVGAAAVHSVSQRGYIYAKGMNFSSDGHVRTFDAAADGMVGGEGVVVIVLKNAIDAVRDGDRIYGLLRGTAVNNDGGEKSGFFAPSVQGQIEVIEKALKTAGVDADTVSYVEAHGTGTRLGDPIEFAALKDVYEKYTARHQFCGIGSIKTNIGHLDTAAGLAGCVKVLLSLTHGEIPPTINYTSPNPLIDLESSPFYVVREPTKLADTGPVRVAVSAFGVGGTNAHAIFERFESTESPTTIVPDESGGNSAVFLVPLSARSDERLIVYAQKLLDFLTNASSGSLLINSRPLSIVDLAYTMQVGREGMSSRAVFIVRSLDELQASLQALINREKESIRFYRGKATESNVLSDLLGEHGADSIVMDWIANGDSARIARAWVNGLKIDWARLTLQSDLAPQRISLPTYPFAEERHWISAQTSIQTYDEKILHPLVHRNISDLLEQRFSSTLSGHEVFFGVQNEAGCRTLSIFGHLEMAIIARQIALRHRCVNNDINQSILASICLHNGTLINPISVADKSIEIYIGIRSSRSNAVDYEIYGYSSSARDDENGPENRTTYAHGRINDSTDDKRSVVDLASLQSLKTGVRLAGQDVQAAFAAMNIAHQDFGLSVTEVFCAVNDAGRHFGIAKISQMLSAGKSDSRCLFLQPVIDAAQRSAMVFLYNKTCGQEQAIDWNRVEVVGIEAAEVWRPLTATSYIYIQYLDDEKETLNFNVHFCSEVGDVLASLLRVSCAVVERVAVLAMSNPPPRTDSRASSSIVNSHSGSAMADPEEGAHSKDIRKEVLSILVRSMPVILREKNEDIDVDRGFGESGFESIALTKFCNYLNETYRLDLTPAIFYEYTTLRTFADHLANKFSHLLIPNTQVVPQLQANSTLMAKMPRPNSDFRDQSQLRFLPAVAKSYDAPIAQCAIAIIGVSGCFPMARDVDTFWENLKTSKDCITEIPKERWDWQSVYGDPLKEENKTNIKWGGFIEGIAEFDPLFFNISPREAESMDPQQRLLMMHVWNAIEDAGYSAKTLSGTKTSLFLGITKSDYESLYSVANVQMEASSATGLIGSLAPNRISYFLNLHGASEPIETTCSSSLVAVNRAVLALRTEPCETAIAGGINVLVSLPMHVAASSVGILSEDGRCKTFSDKANGYVRGEGVGILLLKRLTAAERDRDHIYGVIRASAVNHGGRASSLTAPNPIAQAALLREAYLQAQVDPRSIGFIEVHGTGTELGDPIEINALKSAFSQLYEATDGGSNSGRHCGLGSVKTNIGHLEMAAGVTGIIKVLMQLKHKVLTKSLHCEQVNPFIQLDQSPFYIVHEPQPWEPILDSYQRALPRRAGVSSFGLGGVNAHVVIEEYIEPVRDRSENVLPRSVIFVLSAKNESRLRERVLGMLQFLNSSSLDAIDLVDVAYTLQVGRDPMDWRFALVANSLDDVRQKLQQYVLDQSTVAGVFQGNAKQHREALSMYADDDALKSVVDSWISKGKYERLLELWVKGLSIDWNTLYGEVKPRRKRLPAYPFSRESYWITADGKQPNRMADKISREYSNGSRLHPLLHQNTSDLFEQRYTSTFVARQFSNPEQLSSSAVALPWSVALEMARVATLNACRANQGTDRRSLDCVDFCDIEFLQSVSLDRDQTVHINISPIDQGFFVFELFSELPSEQRLVHARGRTSLPIESTVTPLHLVECGFSPATVLSGEECDRQLHVQGLVTEQRYHTITEIQFCRRLDDSVFLQIQLSMSRNLDINDRDYLLHPWSSSALLDILHTVNLSNVVTGSIEKIQDIGEISEIRILAPWPNLPTVFVHATNVMQTGADSPTFDVDVLDDAGKICICVRGIKVQLGALDKEVGTAVPPTSQRASSNALIPPKEEFERLTFAESWIAEPLTVSALRIERPIVLFLPDAGSTSTARRLAEQAVSGLTAVYVEPGQRYACNSAMEFVASPTDSDNYASVLTSVRTKHESIDIFFMWPLAEASNPADPISIVFLLRAIFSANFSRVRLFVAAEFVDEMQRCHIDSWLGFGRSLRFVLPALEMVIIAEEAIQRSLHKTDAERDDQNDRLTKWLARCFQELSADKTESAIYSAAIRNVCRTYRSQFSERPTILRSGGTYLITGGLGGLAVSFAEHLAKKYRANLILTGRSSLDSKKKLDVEKLESAGGQILYLQCDSADMQGMFTVVEQAEARFGRIHGVLHMAGVEGRLSVVEKQVDDFKYVLSPKIAGTLVLDEIFKNRALDFLCLFSSTAAILGDFGSCDYSVANRFMLAFARYHAQLRSQGLRDARVVAIGWPHWKGGGMGMENDEDEGIQLYFKSSGQRILGVPEGIEIFEQLLSQDTSHHVVMIGQPSRVGRYLGISDAATLGVVSAVVTEKPAAVEPGMGRSSPRSTQTRDMTVEQLVLSDLKLLASKQLKLDQSVLEAEDNLGDFGFDSIGLAEFSRGLSDFYDAEISATVFFSYPTLAKLAKFLSKEHSACMAIFYRPEEPPKNVAAAPLPRVNKERPPSAPQQFRNLNGLTKAGIPLQSPEPIAIIGMSGRFPGARNVAEMWEILANGQDVVTEIPLERFDWRPFYSSAGIEVGRTVSKWLGAMPDVSEFDPLFFEMSPRDAEIMDPRQRLLLQEAWGALENAGFGSVQVETQAIAMFVGAEQGDYQMLAGATGVTSTNDAMLAARLSYFLNLVGPAMIINTACSSGLVAAHQACLSLRAGECNAAIAAGVNMICTPYSYLGMSQAGMLSPDGKCFAFDRRANGMVPGEAVVAVVLKRLSQAESDADPILGVICGSGINYDGKTNGITAPSGASQARLLKNVYKSANVDPRKIEYVITHGTGTKLGDPIEINALSDTFREFTDARQFCAVTSIKSNFGHTFAASGLVSLVSLVQAMNHRFIPASLHCENESEYIRWESCPFYVNKTGKAWSAPADGNLFGAVSAFGMSGTNAHMVVRNYTPVVDHQSVSSRSYMLLALSAKTERALLSKARELGDMLEATTDENKTLLDTCYTLLVGRSHFSYRCAIVVQDRSEAIDLLRAFVLRKKQPAVITGNVARDFRNQPSIFQFGEQLLDKLATTQLMAREDREGLHALAELYCQGYSYSWGVLFAQFNARRIAVPSYPFERERYWVMTQPGNTDSTPSSTRDNYSQSVLHPLLQRNNSNLSVQQFSSTFSGQEFFLNDHRVNGNAVLPGVAYLEMARAAVEMSSGVGYATQSRKAAAVQIRNVVFAQPLLVNKPTDVHVKVFVADSGEIEYEIVSYQENVHADSDTEPLEVVHCQGRAFLVDEDDVSHRHARVELLSNLTESMQAEQCYEMFKSAGMEYGQGLQAVREIRYGRDHDGRAVVAAMLELPDVVSKTFEQFVLHPSLMDGALQATIGLLMVDMDGPQGRHNAKQGLPFAIDQVNIFNALPARVIATIRHDLASTNAVQKLNIAFSNAQGEVCVELLGFTARAMASKTDDEQMGELIISRDWKEAAVVDNHQSRPYARHRVIFVAGMQGEDSSLVSMYHQCAAMLGTTLPLVEFTYLMSVGSLVHDRFSDDARNLLEIVQKVLQEDFKGEVLIQLVIGAADRESQQVFCGLGGLLKTAQLEFPKLHTQVIAFDSAENAIGLARKIEIDAQHTYQGEIRYIGGVRAIAELGELANSSYASQIPWKDDGVYLITGGAGGLGIAITEEICRKVSGAKIVLVGRSVLDGDRARRVAALGLLGAEIRYVEADVADFIAISRCIQDIVVAYGKLDGVVHAAGITHDGFILRKTRDEVGAVLKPKVNGLVNVDQATTELDLDFFLLFSSISGVLGNVGQGDYAMANSFMDHYASYRQSLVKGGKRRGRTLSVAWPLWEEGGMKTTDLGLEQMKIFGFRSLPIADGMKALYEIFGTDKTFITVFSGDKRRARGLIQQLSELSRFSSHASDDSLGDKIIYADQSQKIELGKFGSKAIHYFKKLLASHLKMPIDRLEEDAPFEKYGIDSILVMQMTNELEKSFGSLSKTLLFEYQDIQSLSDYFVESHREQLIKLLGLETGESAVAVEHSAVSQARVSAVAAMGKGHRARYGTLRAVVSEKKVSRDIAIIGLSGRYPQANNVAAFWENLKAGKDSITEIPQSRWDHSIYYDPQKGKFGKSYSKWGGFIDGVDQFDPLFFNISPRDALGMDPQERLFLQCVYETLEDAGYTREALKQYRALGLEGNVGVFVGVMYEEYQLYGAQAQMLGQAYALGGNPSSIANRVSYFCNFHGPSMAVDTMCSSSLTSIHLACQSLINSGCEVAIAGGVNISVHPNKYLTLSQGQFASSTGRCESFGEGGDGYVPGEGVGAVLLKPLSGAIADNDYIYGVIKGTSINHGGKTNGYTVPNPKAQMQVIEQALKEAGVNARAVSYIEAHGTGTSLGDPIEISGLSKAFQVGTQDKQFCAIGSAKSNIGHCESAAGIAGLTKVLLQLKYRTLVPSLHSQVLNPHIDFANSPFVVQRELGEWKRPVLGEGAQRKEYPRIAGISAFGAGGSNAHVVIEEYVDQRGVVAGAVVSANRPAIIVLSAKDEARLKERVEQLLSALGGGEYGEGDLAAIAYTLQLGREAMEQRLALSVVSLSELREKLQRWISGEEGIEELYRGEVKSNKETLVLFTADEDLQKAIGAWIEKGKYSKLLDLWVKGLVFDWHSVHGENKPRRIPLPTYPFAKERYWAELALAEESSLPARGSAGLMAVLHPLAQRNTSNLSEQRYSTTFSGEEFFLSDHRVGGKGILPGVAYLEMARAAMSLSIEGEAELQGAGICLENVVWSRPLVVEGSTEIHIRVCPSERGGMDYEVYSAVAVSDGGAAGEGAAESQEIIYSQGHGLMTSVPSAEQLDCAHLQAGCDRQVAVSDCYEVFQHTGLEYGESHRGLTSVSVGSDSEGERYVLAEVKLPGCVLDVRAGYVLHPSVMDSALQAGIGLVLGSESVGEGGRKAALPFALERLEIFANSPVEGYVYVRRSPSEGHSGVEETLQKLDIDVCDKQGRVCVRLQGLTSRVLTDSAVQSADQDQGMVLLSPCYRALSGEAVEVKYSQQHVVVCGGSVEFQSRLQGSVGGVRCVSAVSSTSESGSSELGARYSECVEAVFEVIQGIVQGKPREEVLLQVVVVKDEASEVLSGLSGLLKTASIEQPKLATQLIEVSASESVAQVLQKLTQNQGYGSDRLIRYEGEVRQVGSFAELVRSGSSEEIPWRSDGVYLITGGVGGLGIIFGAEILSRMPTATVILTGRSALSAEKQSQLDQLRLQGGRIDYLAMDVSEAESVQSGMQEIATKYGLLRGVIHSAGVLRDNYLIKKSVAELRAVLAPKVTGLVHLDEATAQLELDFVVVFSSVAGVFGNAGQGDYASANAFMDQYMEYRRKLVKSGARHGRSVSINWPLWQMGGMQVDAATEQMMSSVGMSPLSSEQGLQAFYTALHSEVSQVVVLAGDRRRLLSRVLGLPAAKAKVAKVAVVAAPLSAVSSAVSAEALDSKAIHYFKKLLASHLKMPIDRLEEDAPFEKYGIDSILVMQMTNELEKSFGSLSKTLLFEYQDIQSLSDYFVESHREQLIKLLGLETGESAVAVEHSAVSQARVSAVAAMGKGHRARYGTLRAVVSEKKVSRDIAIIGLSGRYPQANNVAAFWENLKAGKDSITEIPQSRWDHSIYYDPQKGKFGKSYSKWGGFIDGVDQFDPLFFNISPRDALGMDPQERLFLQCVYETLEDAGYTREALKQYRALGLEGNVGVFVGVMYEEYQLYGAQAQMLGQAYALGGNPSSIANRVSYFCNFHGPSMAVDTMCSSSLTSIHLACQSLINSGCEVAIAGGVNISVHPNKYLTLSQGQFASSTGRCESFGEGGDGYVPGEGVGAVLLKPLSGAIADNDYIYGVIKGTSINHGGKTNGYTVPNPKAQMQVIEQALKEAGVNARAVSYIEAHGTGTSLGDPIEISGLSKAFQVGTQDKQFCAIGSAKSNIGHCESAAGIAGLTKVLLQLKYRTLVPSLHSQVLNPHIDFANSPFVVQRELGEWKRPVLGEGAQRKEYPRIAGISAFGAGGSNAHVVIEEYVDQRGVVAGAVVSANRPAIIVLSAKDEARLKERVEQLLSALGGGEYGEGDLAAIAYTLQLGREAMEQRLALSVVSLSELREKLQRWISGEEGIEELYRGEVKSNKETLVLFTADEDLQKAIGAWIEKGKYSKLLDLWVKGLVFDWHSVHGENKPRRIPLPTYPFAKERYWIQSATEAPVETPKERVSTFSKEFYSKLVDDVIDGTSSVSAAIHKLQNLSKLKDL